jgi:hypothetical protein
MSDYPTNQELTEEVGSGSLVINGFANTGAYQQRCGPSASRKL